MMDTYDWKEYCNSQIKSVVDGLIRGPLENLLSLCKDQCLITEIVIFRKNLIKISARLRNSKISVLLKKVDKLIRLYLSFNVPTLLENECGAFLGCKEVTNQNLIRLPKGVNVLRVLSDMRKLADILDNICKYSSYSVSHCILWLRLGHMIPHFIVCLSTISRLNIICRAILIYISDLYGGLIQYCKLSKDSSNIINDLSIKSGPLKELCSVDFNQDCDMDKLNSLGIEKDQGEVVDRQILNCPQPCNSFLQTEKKDENCKYNLEPKKIVKLAPKSKSRSRRCGKVDLKDVLYRLNKYSSLSILKNLQRQKKSTLLKSTHAK